MSKPDNAVGYGKPPKAHRFKKGKSGNPKGRPKGSKSFRNALNAELDSTIRITEAGKQKKLSKREALAKRIVADALNGNPKAVSELIKQINSDTNTDQEKTEVNTPASEQDKALLASFFTRITPRSGDGNGSL